MFQNSLINFVLVGVANRVELAGYAEMSHSKDYPDMDVAKMEINLIQSGDRILNTMSEASSLKLLKV
jgi:NADH dehydrogenase